MKQIKYQKETKSTNLYICEICDYTTSRHSHLLRHLMTYKHIQTETKTLNSVLLVPNNIDKFTCICGNIYNSRTTLWRHRNKCDEKNKTKPTIINTIMEIAKQNNEFKDLLVEQNKQIIELSSKPTTTNNNQKFNLNSFLNETCKDALNINDFVKNLQITEKDVDETNKIGYVNGITKIFITALEKLEINQRPVHCSDTKRESVYNRHDNKWEKENYLNIKLTYAIGHIVKLLRNTAIQRNELLEKQGIRTNLFPEPRIDVSEVTKPIGMEYTTPKESGKNYDRISRNIMRETNIPK